MSIETVLKTLVLGGGVTATVRDCTRHYFGGYYHVRIQVSADVPVKAALFDSSAEYDDAVLRLGHFVSFNRTLEKMAVPADDIERVRLELLTAFDDNVLPYLQRDGFAPGLVLSELRNTRSAAARSYR